MQSLTVQQHLCAAPSWVVIPVAAVTSTGPITTDPRRAKPWTALYTQNMTTLPVMEKTKSTPDSSDFSQQQEFLLWPAPQFHTNDTLRCIEYPFG